MTRRNLTEEQKEIIVRMYVDEKQSSTYIAGQLGITATGVCSALKRMGIKRRTNSESKYVFHGTSPDKGKSFCYKCGKEIPIRSDRKGNLCTKCILKTKCPDCGQIIGYSKEHICSGIDRRGPRYCIGCKRLLNNNNSERWSKRCGSCQGKINAKKTKAAKKRLVEKFNGECQICGYCRSMSALHFHHIDWDENGSKTRKKHNRSGIAEARDFPERFLLVCANCHFEIHDGLISYKEVLSCQTHVNAKEKVFNVDNKSRMAD